MMSDLRMIVVGWLLGLAIRIAPRNPDGIRFVRMVQRWAADDIREIQ